MHGGFPAARRTIETAGTANLADRRHGVLERGGRGVAATCPSKQGGENPAGWSELLDLVAGRDHPLVAGRE